MKKSIYLAVAALLMLGSCTPDSHSLDSLSLQPSDLTHGSAFSVSVDAQNTVTLKSLLDKSYNCYWIHPNGRAQGPVATLQLPFAGKYDVTFGVDTRGGVVYGNPYQFEVTTNNMALLADPLYTYLTGGVGKSKKWVPVDKDYGVGQCTGPVMYCNPDDVLNDGSNSTDIGINNMKPNWDPGFQSWLIPADDPYMDSYMIFSLDDVNGCSITEYRGEAGTKGSSTGTTSTGKYTLNVSDKNHPTLSFSDAYSMHNVGFDAVCSNYTSNIIITELTPYMLQLATMRTNSEGPWWIIWNFIAADVQDGTVVIPSGDVNYLNPSTPVLPTISDLKTKIFTTDINGVEYEGAEMTFQVVGDAPYDWRWWNGGSNAWESVTGGNYGTNWAPKADEDVVTENELTLTKKGTFTYGNQAGSYTIDEGKIIFDQEVSFFTVTGDSRTIEVKGTEWQVFKCDPGSELVLGVANGKDTNGNINNYLVANFSYKAVGGGQTGPVNVPFDAAKVNNYIDADKYFRCQLYNPWGGGNDAIDPANVKLKKDQKINITVKLSGFTFSQTAKMALCCNRGNEQGWEPDCFGYARAIDVNSDGTYTVSWTNDTGSTVKWDDGTSALTITLQFAGYATLPDDDYASHCTVESITIE